MKSSQIQWNEIIEVQEIKQAKKDTYRLKADNWNKKTGK
jgi:hypothetical protein